MVFTAEPTAISQLLPPQGSAMIGQFGTKWRSFEMWSCFRFSLVFYAFRINFIGIVVHYFMGVILHYWHTHSSSMMTNNLSILYFLCDVIQTIFIPKVLGGNQVSRNKSTCHQHRENVRCCVQIPCQDKYNPFIFLVSLWYHPCNLLYLLWIYCAHCIIHRYNLLCQMWMQISIS